MTDKTKVYPSKDEVEFRTPNEHGDVVVRIFFGGRTPRFMCTFNIGMTQHPISMCLHEINHYIQEAVEIQKKLQVGSQSS